MQKAGHDQITTEILDAPKFYYAEDYHQQYLAKNPRGYCGLGGTGVSCPDRSVSRRMKLATLRVPGARDGRLVIVSRDLSRAADASTVVPTLQAALDDWSRVSSRLRRSPMRSSAERQPFIRVRSTAWPRRCRAPTTGSTAPRIVESRRAGAQGARRGDARKVLDRSAGVSGRLGRFHRARDDVPVPSEEFGIDLEGEVAVITDDVPMGTTPARRAASTSSCSMLVNDWSLRNLIPGDSPRASASFNRSRATAFSPVAVTPDELGDAWDGGKSICRWPCTINGEPFGAPEAGVDMTFNFPRLIAHVAKTRNARAGTIVGSGTVSNYDRSRGSACLAERRTLERSRAESRSRRF